MASVMLMVAESLKAPEETQQVTTDCVPGGPTPERETAAVCTAGHSASLEHVRTQRVVEANLEPTLAQAKPCGHTGLAGLQKPAREPLHIPSTQLLGALPVARRVSPDCSEQESSPRSSKSAPGQPQRGSQTKGR